MNDIQETIQQFILANYLPGESRETLRMDTPLQTSGILDSLATQNLVSFVAQRFVIELDTYETGIESFDCIKDIAALVERKQALCQSTAAAGLCACARLGNR